MSAINLSPEEVAAKQFDKLQVSNRQTPAASSSSSSFATTTPFTTPFTTAPISKPTPMDLADGKERKVFSPSSVYNFFWFFQTPILRLPRAPAGVTTASSTVVSSIRDAITTLNSCAEANTFGIAPRVSALHFVPDKVTLEGKKTAANAVNTQFLAASRAWSVIATQLPIFLKYYDNACFQLHRYYCYVHALDRVEKVCTWLI